MGEIVRYKHFCNSGDLIASLPGIKEVYDVLGKKGVIQQRLNMECYYYPGATHPVVDNNGNMVTMSQKQWDMLKPLLESQDYIDSTEIWEGQDTDVDLNKMREGDFTTMGYGSINRWVWYVWPELACDLSKPWINVEANRPDLKDMVILNFTSRYRNPLITYFFLKKYEDRLIFAGLEGEYRKFCEDNKLEIPCLVVKDFLELAQAIKSCKFVLCNQSMVWNIAEAMKVRRILEVCRSASNCIPNGPEGYDYLQQRAVEFYVNKYINR